MLIYLLPILYTLAADLAIAAIINNKWLESNDDKCILDPYLNDQYLSYFVTLITMHI